MTQSMESVTAPDLTGTWTVDAARSSIEFSARSMWGRQALRGEFRSFAGELVVAEDGLSGQLRIDAKSLHTPAPTLTAHLRSGSYFGARRHPLIVVTSESIGRRGSDGTVAAALRVRDTEAHMDMPFSATLVDAETMHVDGETTMTLASVGFANPLSIVRGDVTVRGHLVLQKQTPARASR